MLNKYVKVALLAFVTSATLIATPLTGVYGEPVKLSASTENQNLLDYGTAKPVSPTEGHSVWGDVYSRPYFINVYSKYLSDDTMNKIVVGSTKNTVGYLTTKGSGVILSNGCNITDNIKITNQNEYMTRSMYYYTPSMVDTYKNFLDRNNSATHFYITPSEDCIFKIRKVSNETKNDYTGITLTEDDGSIVQGRVSDDNIDVNNNKFNSRHFSGYRLKKGKRYTLRFCTAGIGDLEKYDMFTIKESDYNNNFKEGTWNIFNLNWVAAPSIDADVTKMAKEKFTFDMNKLSLKTDSTVTIELKNLTYAYENWKCKNVVDFFRVYDYNKINKSTDSQIEYMDETKYGVVKTVKLPKNYDLSKGVKVTFKLSKGTYYIPCKLGFGTDFAFKYKVTPVSKLSGTTIKGKITTSTTKLTGTCSKNSRVYAKIGSKTYKDTTTSNGSFSIKIPKQKEGTKITLYEKRDGYTSDKETIKVTKSTKATDSFSKAKLTANTVYSNSTKISGKCYKGTTVSVKVGKKTYKDKTTSSGKYTIKTPKIKAGTKLTITQKDSTGKKTKKTVVTVKHIISKYTPSIKATKGKTKVSGKGYSVKSTMHITIGDKVYKAKTNEKGEYSIKTCKITKGVKIKVYQQVDKYKSKTKTIKIN